MSAAGPARGDGIGIEATRELLRGVRLCSSEDGRVAAAAEVPVRSPDDDRSVLDALVRLRAELGDVKVPTRVAQFPTNSTLTRLDATGLGPSDLNARRAELDATHQASSSVLVDDGPRRWLVGLSWDDTEIRRIEELAERAGFIDIASDPSPLALVRVLDDRITHVRRDAAADQSFGAIVSSGAVVAASTLESVGRTLPGLDCSDAPVSAGWFDGIVEPGDLTTEVRRLIDDAAPLSWQLQLATVEYPEFPPHDLRSPARQCVALGAALGAAGLAGRLRPVDMLLRVATVSDELERPWAIERLSDLPTPQPSAPSGRTKRMLGRVRRRQR